jgi:transcriptional regulator with XRE-family HTH domain
MQRDAESRREYILDSNWQWCIIHVNECVYSLQTASVILFHSILQKLFSDGGPPMTISERIFEKLAQMHMTQKQFSEETGILQSTISEWKKKKTNPTSEKIMVICKVLDVTPEWLLSGIEKNGSRKSRADWYVVGKKTELGHLINAYNNMGKDRRNRLMGYVEAIESMEE